MDANVRWKWSRFPRKGVFIVLRVFHRWSPAEKKTIEGKKSRENSILSYKVETSISIQSAPQKCKTACGQKAVKKSRQRGGKSETPFGNIFPFRNGNVQNGNSPKDCPLEVEKGILYKRSFLQQTVIPCKRFFFYRPPPFMPCERRFWTLIKRPFPSF